MGADYSEQEQKLSIFRHLSDKKLVDELRNAPTSTAKPEDYHLLLGEAMARLIARSSSEDW